MTARNWGNKKQSMNQHEFLLKCNDIEDGDTLLSMGKSKPHSLLKVSEDIENEMRLYAKNFHVDPELLKMLNGFVGSHSATFFRERGVLYIYGSLISGFKKEPFLDNYSYKDKILVIRNKTLTQQQKDDAFRYAQWLVERSTGYPIYELLTWMLYIRTKWEWPMVWGGSRYQVCFAQSYRMEQFNDPTLTKQPQIASFYDLIRLNSKIILDNRNGFSADDFSKAIKDFKTN